MATATNIPSPPKHHPPVYRLCISLELPSSPEQPHQHLSQAASDRDGPAPITERDSLGVDLAIIPFYITVLSHILNLLLSSSPLLSSRIVPIQKAGPPYTSLSYYPSLTHRLPLEPATHRSAEPLSLPHPSILPKQAFDHALLNRSHSAHPPRHCPILPAPLSRYAHQRPTAWAQQAGQTRPLCDKVLCVFSSGVYRNTGGDGRRTLRTVIGPLADVHHEHLYP